MQVKELFEGEYESYVQCVDVDYRSSTKATFKDLTLNLLSKDRKPIKSLKAALEDWAAPELLVDFVARTN